MSKQRPTLILTNDSSVLADHSTTTGSITVLLHISRTSIESCNVASSLEKLLVLTDTREAFYRFRESLAICIDGYDHDARQLAEIPEVRAYFARLTQEWPHWLWFLVRDAGMIALLMSMLCPVAITRRGDLINIDFHDRPTLGQKLKDLFERGNVLFRAYEVSAAEASTSATGVTHELL